MTKTFKTFAAATLISTLSVPAFAAADFDINSMTCEEYNQLGGADRDRAAVLAVMELNDDVVPSDGTATATENSVGTAPQESEPAASQRSATATSTADAGDDMSRFAEEIGVLNRTCARSWEATLIEAAAGMEGTR